MPRPYPLARWYPEKPYNGGVADLDRPMLGVFRCARSVHLPTNEEAHPRLLPAR
jgi:hypothetical protein